MSAKDTRRCILVSADGATRVALKKLGGRTGSVADGARRWIEQKLGADEFGVSAGLPPFGRPIKVQLPKHSLEKLRALAATHGVSESSLASQIAAVIVSDPSD